MPDKALLLGINDYLNVNDLRGCVRDVENMKGMLVDVFGFAAGHVKTLTDKRVVKSEVKKQMALLFKDVEPGDRVVLHFSGHGSYTADQNGDENDGRDELVCLYDMDFDNPDSYLLDDELRAWTETKPDGVRLTIVLDNCNSGTGTRMLLPHGVGQRRAGSGDRPQDGRAAIDGPPIGRPGSDRRRGRTAEVGGRGRGRRPGRRRFRAGSVRGTADAHQGEDRGGSREEEAGAASSR